MTFTQYYGTLVYAIACMIVARGNSRKKAKKQEGGER